MSNRCLARKKNNSISTGIRSCVVVAHADSDDDEDDDDDKLRNVSNSSRLRFLVLFVFLDRYSFIIKFIMNYIGA